MATLNYEQRQAMIGRRYVSDMNHPDEMAVTIGDVRLAANGFTVAFMRNGIAGLSYLGLRRFLKRYPHQIED